MQNLTLTWQTSVAASAALYGAAFTVRRIAAKRAVAATGAEAGEGPGERRGAGRVAADVLREAGTLLALFALWQVVGHLSLMGTDHALERAEWIHRTETDLGLPDEASWQRAVVGHPWLAQAANYYYATMHFGVMLVVLLWLFLRHRERYAWVRTTVVATTAVCLLIQFVPVAPPRMLPGNGFMDLAAQYGQSVYGNAVAGVVADQLSAMPSVHVAWCVITAVAVIAVARGPWRWLMVLHPLVTVWVVVVTANHFWADGVVALAILLTVYLVQAAVTGWRRPEAEAGADAPEAERERSAVQG